MERPDFFELKNGEKVKLPFTEKEYQNRLNKLFSNTLVPINKCKFRLKR